MKAPAEERAFQFISTWNPLCSVSEGHGVFRNRDLCSTSVRQLRATAIGYLILGISYAPQLTIEKGFSHALSGGFVK